MPMINCPECGKQISDKADKCPNCGYPLNKVQTTPQATEVKTKKKTGLDILIAILLFIIPLAPIGIILMWVKKFPERKSTRIIATVIFGIIFLFWSCSGKSDNNKVAQNTTSTTAQTSQSSNDSKPKESEPTETPKQEAEPEPKITYTVYTVTQMMDDLDKNALKAESTYKDQYVEITGRLGTIDSSGKYITLYPEDNEWAFVGVQCYIKNEEQKAKVMEMSTDDIVTLKGKIKSVGEVLGYSLDIDEID